MSVMSFITASHAPHTCNHPLTAHRPFRPRPLGIRLVQSLDISVALSLFSATLGSSFVYDILRLSSPCPVFCQQSLSVLHCTVNTALPRRSVVAVIA